MTSAYQTELDFVTGQLVSDTVERHGNALIETVAGADLLTKIAKQYMNCSSEHTQGRIFEALEVTKFNVNAAKANSILRAVTTDQLGMPHHEADIFIQDSSGDVLRKIQAKSSKSAASLASYIKDDKYKGMDRLVNTEHEERVRELMEQRIDKNGVYAEQYKDAHKHLKGEIEQGGITSGGTTYAEAKNAAENHEKVAAELKKQEFFSGVRSAMLGGALAGAVIGGGAKAVQGAFTGDFCVKETGKVAANNAARGAVISGASYGIKFLGKNNPIMTGNVAAALASSAVSMTESTYQFLKGNISIEQYVESLGSNAVSCFSGIVMTAAGAALFGPIGAAVAGTVAVIGMKQLYKVFTTAREDVQLAKEARQRAEQLSELMIQQIKEEERIIVSYYEEYEETLASLKQLVDLALIDDQFTESSIVSLASQLNVAIKYEKFDEFEAFMLSDEVLKL